MSASRHSVPTGLFETLSDFSYSAVHFGPACRLVEHSGRRGAILLQLFEQRVVQLGHELSSRRTRGEISPFESLEPATQIEERVRVFDTFALEHFANFATLLLVLFVGVLNAPLSRPYRNHQTLLLFDGGDQLVWCLVLNFEDATYVHYLNIFRRDKLVAFTSSWDN